MIAREVSMRGRRVEAIRYAGMLHDVGKLGVPPTVLQKNGALTEEELAAIQLHPSSSGASRSWARGSSTRPAS